MWPNCLRSTSYSETSQIFCSIILNKVLLKAGLRPCALAFVSQNWYNAIDNSKDGRSGVHAIFLDFRKTSDLVDHIILLWKLAELNVNKSFWLRITRSQQVNLGGIKSS